MALLAEALSRRSGYPKADRSWMTQAEAIMAALVGQAAGLDLKAKRLLFDVPVKLQQANICWSDARLPEIQLDDGEGDAGAAEIDRLAEIMSGEAAAQGPTSLRTLVRDPIRRRRSPGYGHSVTIGG